MQITQSINQPINQQQMRTEGRTAVCLIIDGRGRNQICVRHPQGIEAQKGQIDNHSCCANNSAMKLVCGRDIAVGGRGKPFAPRRLVNLSEYGFCQSVKKALHKLKTLVCSMCVTALASVNSDSMVVLGNYRKRLMMIQRSVCVGARKQRNSLMTHCLTTPSTSSLNAPFEVRRVSRLR